MQFVAPRNFQNFNALNVEAFIEMSCHALSYTGSHLLLSRHVATTMDCPNYSSPSLRPAVLQRMKIDVFDAIAKAPAVLYMVVSPVQSMARGYKMRSLPLRRLALSGAISTDALLSRLPN